MSYQDDVAASLSQRQADHKAASTDAQHATAEVNHYSRLVTASRTWGVKNGAMKMLLQLGGQPPAGSFVPGDF